jgi:hypothetical protein
MEATTFDVTRKWIERAIYSGDDIYLVVGFHTVTDARIVHESVEGRQRGGQVALPVGLSLTAVGIIAPLGNIVDPGVHGHQLVVDGAKTQYLAPGEQVCAFQYRKLRHRWLSSRKIDSLSLSKVPQWTASESWRTADNEQAEEEPNTIEVEMEELQELEGDWDQEEAEGGEILLLRSVDTSDE